MQNKPRRALGKIERAGHRNARRENDAPPEKGKEVLLGGRRSRGRVGGGLGGRLVVTGGLLTARDDASQHQTQQNDYNVCPFHSGGNLYQNQKGDKKNLFTI
jgi:hypothetical protein